MNERPIYKAPPGARGGGRPGLNRRRLGGLACIACALTLAGATLGNGVVASTANSELPAGSDQSVVDSGGNRQNLLSAIRAQIARIAPAVAAGRESRPSSKPLPMRWLPTRRPRLSRRPRRQPRLSLLSPPPSLPRRRIRPRRSSHAC